MLVVIVLVVFDGWWMMVIVVLVIGLLVVLSIWLVMLEVVMFCVDVELVVSRVVMVMGSSCV